MTSPGSDKESLESEVWLDRLEKLANHRAASSESIGDLEKAASAARLIASARSTREQLKHQTYRLRLEEAKSWALLSLPVLVLLSLLIFIPGPNQQARALLQANHDTQFREVERNFLTQVMQSGTLGRPDLLLLSVPLQPYANDQRYAKEVSDLSLLVLARMTSADAFQDYFVSRNIRVGMQNLPAVLTLDRMLYTNFNELDEALNSDNITSAAGVLGRPLTRDQAQRARDGILLELSFLSGKTAALLRSTSGPLNGDLRRVYFKSADLSNVHFGKTSLDGCQWESVSLANADLSSIAEFENSQWIDTNWWEARAISKPLLIYLIATQYPFHPPQVDSTLAPASREAYEHKVLKLCQSAGMSCDASRFAFGAAPKGDKRSKS